MSKVKSPIVAIVISLGVCIAVIVAIYSIVKPVSVVEAKVAISAGTVLTQDLIEVKTVPSGGLPADYYANIADVIGKTVAVSRAAGDFITTSILSETASAGVPSELEPGHVAIAIHVDRAKAVAGILRSGQTVTIIGLLAPDVLQNSSISGSFETGQTIIDTSSQEVTTADLTTSSHPTPTPEPTKSVGPLARITLTGIRILMVPQDFQYQEIPANADQQTLFANQQATSNNASVIVLNVPNTAVEIAPGYKVNPATLIAALDQYGSITLALESSVAVEAPPDGSANLTLNLAELYQTLNKNTGLEPTPTVQK